MKNYILTKKDLFGIYVKKINYDFKLQNTSRPTKFIRIIVHHTKNRSRIQEIIDLHVKKNRWSAIGYHFMIGKNGQIYYSRDLEFAGAHTYHHNRNSIGIALFGNFDENKPSQRQIESLNKLISVLKSNFQIKEVMAHNEVIYDYVKSKYFKLDLPDIKPLDFKRSSDSLKFIQDISTKVLESDASDEAVSTIKRLTTCPGLYMYQIVKELK